MYEVIIIWDSEFFMHQTLEYSEALEWAKQYPAGENCKIRIWRLF